MFLSISFSLPSVYKWINKILKKKCIILVEICPTQYLGSTYTKTMIPCVSKNEISWASHTLSGKKSPAPNHTPRNPSPLHRPPSPGAPSEGLTVNFHFCFRNNPGPRRRAPPSPHPQPGPRARHLPSTPSCRGDSGRTSSASPMPGTAPGKDRVQVGEVGCRVGGKGDSSGLR